MHEQTRKFIFLLIFFLFGPLLTLGIGGAIVLRKVPSNAGKLEYEWTKQTGIRWTIQSVEYRTAALTRLKKVRVLDNATNNTVFFAPEIDIRYYAAEPRELLKLFPNIASQPFSPAGSLMQSFRPASWETRTKNGYYQITVPASLLTLEKYSAAEADSAVKDTLAKLVSRLPFLSETPMLFAFEECGICRPETAQNIKPERFRYIKGNLYRTETDIRSDWAFQLPAVSELEMQKISVVKQRTGNGLEITLRTGKRTIPCEIAGIFSAAFRQLGSGSRFSGTFSIDKGQWTMENVVFRNIALEPLAAQYSPLSVTGTVVDLQIHKAVFGNGMFSAEGCTQIADGTLDKMLFRRLIDHFRLTVNPSESLEAPHQNVAFDGCAVHFKMQQDGIVFWGDKLWEDGQLLMYRKGDTLRTQPMYILLSGEKSPPVSYHSVLSLFAPDDAPVVPLTPGLQQLVGAVPIK